MKKIVRLRSVAFFILLFISGCGMWQNFTTYFNLYFNTKQAYETALADIEELRENVFDLKEPKITKDIDKNLDKVIEKGSKILQYDAESAYVDDALFMTGVAFYYKGQYAKAIRKFKELAMQEEEDYKYKNRLWLAKSYLQLRNFEEGSTALEELKEEAIAAEKDEIVREVYRTLIAYEIDRNNINTAISGATELLNTVDDDELRSEVAYQIGMLYIRQNQTEQAVSAFESALTYSPDFETEFKSKFEIAKLKKQLGQREESYKMLQSLYNEGRFKEYWGDVYYEMGLMQYEDGNSKKAFEIFTEVESLYAETEGAGRSQLMLGEIMKNEYADYDSALFYYDKVAKSKVTDEIKEEAKQYSNSIQSYLLMKKNIRNTARQIEYLDDPKTFVIDSLAYQRYLEKRKNEEISGQIPTRNQRGRSVPDEEETDTTTSAETTTADSTVAADSLFNEFGFEVDEEYIVKEKPIRPRVDIDSLRAEQQSAYFELGNLFFVDYQKPDSAYHYYSKILNDFDNVRKRPRILYALGTYYESTEQKEKADSLYNFIYDEYKTHRVANQAALKIGKPPLIIEEDPAKKMYLEAEEEIDSSNTDSAFVLLTRIAEDYPESIYAPKSIYTKGWLYENVMDKPDSAMNMYSQLVDNFKNSLYASNVKDKVEAYNVMQAVEDSIARANEAAEQSLMQPEVQDSTEAIDVEESLQGEKSEADSSGVVDDSPGEKSDSLEIPEITDSTEAIDVEESLQGEKSEADSSGVVNDSPGEKSDSLKTPEIMDSSNATIEDTLQTDIIEIKDSTKTEEDIPLKEDTLPKNEVKKDSLQAEQQIPGKM